MKKERLLLVLAIVISFTACTSRVKEKHSYIPLTSKVEFPKDHLMHDDYNEWIYFSGVVETTEGKELGLMFTIFQYGEPGNFTYPYMLAVSDPEDSVFYSTPREGIEGNAVTNNEGLPVISALNCEFNWKTKDELFISSSTKTVDSIDLKFEMNLKPQKDILLHGEDGFILMGDSVPSGYYSLTNLLPTDGKLIIDEESFNIVGGRIWMDHQWGAWGGLGYLWDWFSVRFDDGGSLMLFQFRDNQQRPSIGNWTYRDKDGNITYGNDFSVEAKRKIGLYPIDWTVSIPSLNAQFEVHPLFDDQIFPGLIWEGLCSTKGKIGDTSQTGDAFVELCGY